MLIAIKQQIIIIKFRDNICMYKLTFNCICVNKKRTVMY